MTLEVTPEQAARLVHGINNYTLYAGLRGSELKVNPKLSVNDLTMLGDCGQVNILWDADPTALERYRFALGADTQALDSAALVARALHENLGIQQVIIGPEVRLEQACELAEAARLDRPELGVILLRHRMDVTALAQALRSGVREVVTADDHTRPGRGPAAQPGPDLAPHRSLDGWRRPRRARSSRSSPPRAASARRPCPRTSARPPREHRASRRCSSTSTSRSATSRSACS